MPEEGKANLLTPADQRRRQRSTVLVFGLFLAVVLAALATTVLAVNDGRNYKRLVRRLGLETYLLAATPPDLRIGKQKRLVPGDRYPPWLMSRQLERAALLERNEPLSAEERCNLLKITEEARPDFTTADKDWECLFFTEFGTSPEPGSLFIQARGAIPDAVRSFRIKLSLTDPMEESSMLQAAMTAIERFRLPMTPETRTYLAEMLATRRPFSSIVENYRMTFSQEMTDARRYNLLILPRPQTIACGGSPPMPSDRAKVSIFRMRVACLALRDPQPGLPAS